MDMEDDSQLFSPSEQSSSPVHARKLKRLKKATSVSSDDVVAKQVNGQVLGSSEALESNEGPLRFDSGKELDSGFAGEGSGSGRDLEFDGDGEDQGGEKGEAIGDPKADESLDSEGWNEESLQFDFGSEMNSTFDEDGSRTKRVLEFGGDGEDPSEEMREETGDLRMGESERKRGNSEDLGQKRVKRKKKLESVADDGKLDACASGRRMTEKERRARLSELHAETQRLLRETRDTTFKPAKPVQKSISSILEKIRQRKLEVSKRTVSLNNNCSIAEDNSSLREVAVALDSENRPKDKRGDDEFTKVAEETVAHAADVDSRSDGFHESLNHSSQENTPLQMDSEEKPTHAFRAPIDDTQDLFCASQTSDVNDELPNEQHSSPLEEVLEPSLLAMNLKLDSAPVDDVSSNEEDNDKENIDPDPHRPIELCSSPKGDPVKAFVDDEAEEEDDSDNDLIRFQENEEDEDNGGSEELNDLIATEYEENPIDGEKRNQLHQQWLEQQDAAGTDNLLQRLKCGPEQRETAMLGGEDDDDEEEDNEEEEEFCDEALEGLGRANLVRMNSRKIKQMIPQMFTDKDDGFLSSDDEETEKMLVKQRLLEKAEEQATLLSPEEDENSREVFGLIKKLNIVPDTKRKAKASSVLGMLLKGRNSNNSSKSSFLGRASNQSLPSSHKPGSTMVRSFIFGRDDSNSRSTISMSEDSSDKIQNETRPKRTASAKFSSSQSKFSTQNTKVAVEKTSGTSLFEILRRSSLQSNSCPQDNVVGENQSVFAAFRLTKKSIKVEGRT